MITVSTLLTDFPEGRVAWSGSRPNEIQRAKLHTTTCDAILMNDPFPPERTGHNVPGSIWHLNHARKAAKTKPAICRFMNLRGVTSGMPARHDSTAVCLRFACHTLRIVHRQLQVNCSWFADRSCDVPLLSIAYRRVAPRTPVVNCRPWMRASSDTNFSRHPRGNAPRAVHPFALSLQHAS